MASTVTEMMRRRFGGKKGGGMTISELVDALNDGETFTDAEVNAVCDGNYGALVKIKAGVSMKITFNHGVSSNQKTIDNTSSATARYFWIDAGESYTSIRSLFEMNNTSAVRGYLLELRYIYMPPTVNEIRGVFNSTSSVTYINLSNWAGTYTNLASFVNSASALTSLDMSAMTINCTSLYQLFNHCNALTTVDLGTMDFSNLTGVSSGTWDMPFFATALSTITGTLSNLGKGFTGNSTFNLANTNLNHDSAMRIINALVAPTTSGITPTIKFKAATYNSLSAEEKALITAAGWTDGNAS